MILDEVKFKMYDRVLDLPNKEIEIQGIEIV